MALKRTDEEELKALAEETDSVVADQNKYNLYNPDEEDVGLTDDTEKARKLRDLKPGQPEVDDLEEEVNGQTRGNYVDDPYDTEGYNPERARNNADYAISQAKGYLARQKDPNFLSGKERVGGSVIEPNKPSEYDDATYADVSEKLGVGGHLKSVGDAADGGGTVVGTGVRLADDRSWEKKYDEMMARKRAERAGLKAQRKAMQDLLATGRYFDDGRGGIKLKNVYREKLRPDSTRRGWHVDTLPDDGTAALAMNKAAQTAYDASMKGWQDALNEQNAEKASASRKKVDDVISLNRQSLKNIETMKAERAKNQARSKFNMVEGYIAAMDALKAELANTDESSFSPIKAWGRGVDGSGKDENGRDARWKYDDNGRVIGQAEAQPTGKYMKKGFVTGPALQALNQRIREHGGNYKIVGLMATQKFNDVKGSAYGKPVVYARIETFDEASGKPVYHDEVFTPERAYELGMEAGKEGGIDDYKNLVWQGVGDIHGEREREVAAANLKHEQNLELEEAKQKNRLEIAEVNNRSRAEIEASKNKSREEIAARDAEIRRDLAAIRMAYERAMKGDKKAESDFKRIREIQSALDGPLNSEQRAALRSELQSLVDQHIQKTASGNNGGGGAQGANKGEVKQDDNVEPEEIPGYAPEQIAELKKRGYRWNGSKWEK